MQTTSLLPAASLDRTTGPWAAAGAFLDGLTGRDFAALADGLDPDVRMRALVPRGPLDVLGRDAVVDRFRTWFDTDEDFEVVEAALGQVGSRVYLQWHVRLTRPGVAGGREVQQHAFATVAGRIRSLDLLCSGFQAVGAGCLP